MISFSGFDWDGSNRAKCRKHGVSTADVEAVFAGAARMRSDVKHSRDETRFFVVGRSPAGRMIFAVCTLRRFGDEVRVRPISARFMHDKEVRHHEEGSS